MVFLIEKIESERLCFPCFTMSLLILYVIVCIKKSDYTAFLCMSNFSLLFNLNLDNSMKLSNVRRVKMRSANWCSLYNIISNVKNCNNTFLEGIKNVKMSNLIFVEKECFQSSTQQHKILIIITYPHLIMVWRKRCLMQHWGCFCLEANWACSL